MREFLFRLQAGSQGMESDPRVGTSVFGWYTNIFLIRSK